MLIVAGVLIALGANSWWEARKDRERERAYLQQLLSEMRDNEREIRAEITNDSTSMASNQRFLDLAFADSDTRLGEWPGTRTGSSVFEPLTGAYTALVQSGDLHLVRSDDIRIGLITYASKLAGVQEHLQLYAMRVWEHLDRVALADVIHGGGQPETPSEEWQEAMLGDPEVITAMVLQRSLHRSRMALLHGLEGPTRNLICLLQAELEGVEVVELKPASASTQIGETARLDASVRFSTDVTQDGCPVSWESDDDDVASVEGGVITGVAEGEATITATFYSVSGSAHVAVGPGE